MGGVIRLDERRYTVIGVLPAAASIVLRVQDGEPSFLDLVRHELAGLDTGLAMQGVANRVTGPCRSILARGHPAFQADGHRMGQ
ncbi:MAG: hypothetical protein ACREL7_12555 [Longimicrobiales bacterium]